MASIAIVHFTGPSVIGGVEYVIAAQARVLAAAGHGVRLVAGSGSMEGVDVRRISLMDPAHEEIRVERARYRTDLPPLEHPLVVSLSRALQEALRGAGQVWVHNAFTVFLNPFLTVALLEKCSRPDGRRWVAWCEDDTNLSTYQASVAGASLPAQVEVATISRTRRTTLATRLGRPQDTVAVIEPPVSAEHWLDFGAETHDLLARVELIDADVVTITPSKLLPHKNLEKAVSLAAELRERGARPLVLITGAPSAHEPQISDRVADALHELVAAAELQGSVVLIRDVLDHPPSDRTVRELLLLADVLFLPSLEEGYGLPLAEAALLRVPTVCSDVPIFREVAGDWANFVPPDATAGQVADAVMELVGQPENIARRSALRSWRRFEDAVRALAAQ